VPVQNELVPSPRAREARDEVGSSGIRGDYLAGSEAQCGHACTQEIDDPTLICMGWDLAVDGHEVSYELNQLLPVLLQKRIDHGAAI
jgi:hypothetical protein